MLARDYYEILGVHKDASQQEIKHAYRHLALRYHPDTPTGGEETADRFKEISEAYAVLGDPEKRGRYDTFGHPGPGRPAAGGTDAFLRMWQHQGGFGCRGRGMGFGRRGCGMRRRFFAAGHGSGARPRVVAEMCLTAQEALSGAEKQIALNAGGFHRQLRVKIPAGVKGGETLVVMDEDASPDGPEIYLHVTLTD